MNEMQTKWEAMCDAHRNEEWKELETLAREVKALLNDGGSPNICENTSNDFNRAMAIAGVDFMLDRFPASG